MAVVPAAVLAGVCLGWAQALAFMVVLALGWGGGRYPWASPPILALMTTSLLFWALFAWRTHVFDEPLIPTRILGLPIVRTSVDHGTALPLAGTGRARPDSLFAAVELALELV